MFSVDPQRQYNDTVSADSFQTNTLFSLVFHTINGDTVVTKHDVVDKKMGAGIVVDPIDIIQSTIDCDVKQYSHSDSLLPKHVILDNHRYLVWHKPAKLNNMWFQLRSAKSISLRVWWPNLVFVCDKQARSLSIFATATASRPHANTMLYKAPLMNISDNGRLCLGSARLPNLLNINTMQAIEDCLIESNFSDLHGVKDENYDYMLSNNHHVKFYRKRQSTKSKFRAKELRAYKPLQDILG